jgi:hypothetical protein
MAAPITYKRLVLSGEKAKATADEVKAKMSKDWKRDFPDGKLDIKTGMEGKMVIDVTTKDTSAASLASKIKDVASRNKVTVVTKDKPTLKAVKENDTKKPAMTDDELMKKIKSSLTFQVSGGKKGKPGLQEGPMDKRIAVVFLKYKGKSFPMDYKTGSMFARFVGDLESSGAFSSEDEVSDFMSSEEFDTYANKFNVEIDYADYDPTPLELAPKEPINPQDMIPGRAPKDFINADIPHRMTDLFEKLKKTGKLKKSELTEIIKKYNFESFDNLESAIKHHENGDGYYDRTRLITIFNQLEASDQQKARTKYSEYFGKKK